ncbi:unnamed protein product [Owenia fusiformis]|uniref:5' exonuclease Apollo n=1 Tax=Owenia fusiformis TaxID=6347 RepID=A0A8S4NPI3_OWEFU|nr:unnamed protein product [Owenia fusiformis]
MNGCVVSDTPIAVDMWKVRLHPCVKLFFLSHMHGDHTVGLTASWKDNIYCSPVSGKLLRQRIKVKECFIKPLELNTSHLLPLDETGKETMTVTLIDANHCPGAVMFFFQGYFGSILYTGDMRYHSDMFLDPSPLCNLTTPIDVLYLDNTYNDPQCVFSTRDEATNEILEIIRAHPEHDILLGMKNLGKEDLFVQVAMELNEWIVVTEDTYNDFIVLELPNVFTTDHKLGRLQIVKSFKITSNTIATLNRQQPTIGIIPTALFTGTGLNPYSNCDDIFIVNYSDHSSYTELHDFVSQVKPRSIIPVVKCTRGVFNSDWTSRGNMSCFTTYLDPTPKVVYEVPPSVKQYMNAGNVNPYDSSSAAKSKKNVAMIKRYKLQRTQSYPKTNRPKGIVFPDSPEDPKPRQPARMKMHIIFDSDDDGEQTRAVSIKNSPPQLNETAIDSKQLIQDTHTKHVPSNDTGCVDNVLGIALETTHKKDGKNNPTRDSIVCPQSNHQPSNSNNESPKYDPVCIRKHLNSYNPKRRKLPLTLTQPQSKRYRQDNFPQRDCLNTWFQSVKPEPIGSNKKLSLIKNGKINSQMKQIEKCDSTEGTYDIDLNTNKSVILPFKDGTQSGSSKLYGTMKSINFQHEDGSTSVKQKVFNVKTVKSLKCKPINDNIKNTKIICKTSKSTIALNCKPLKRKTKV